MDRERWKQIDRLFQAALDLPAEGREAFLRSECADDPELEREVRSLLESDGAVGSFLEHPAAEAAAEAMARNLGGGAPVTENNLAGRSILHYRIVSKLGAGGMGEVWRARDTKLNRDVALKILPEVFSGDPELMARFKREARVLASLNHPNIASIYGFEESDGVSALVMELVEGQTLAHRLKSGPIALDEALPIARQIADALESAHEKGVIHRDLKPANIGITSDGNVKVLDFGLAKALEVEAPGTDPDNSPTASPSLSLAATRTGVILGTASYMSPEQARGKKADRRTDIWAFGCVLFEMITGKRLFEGETASDTLAAILKTEPELGALPGDTPPRIRELIRRCLVKDSKQRLRDIGDARIAIEEMIAGPVAPLYERRPDNGDAASHRPALQPGPSDSQMVAALVKRHKGKLALAAALLAAIVMTGSYAIYRLSRPAALQQIAAPQASATNMQISQLTTSGTALLAAISPDGRYVAYVQQGAKGQSLRLRQVATGSTVQIVPPAGVIYIGLTFSPDGNYLDYVQAPQSGAQPPALYQAPVLGGQTHKLLASLGSAVAFSPDGKRIAFVRGLSGGETQLVVAHSDGSGERVLASKKFPEMLLPALFYGKPAWSPDGRVIAVTAGTYTPWETHAAVFDVGTGRELRVGSRHWAYLEQMAWQPDGKGLLLEASEPSTPGRHQIWRLSYPDGKLSRITDDLNDYRGVSITADGAALATVQTRAASNIWAAPESEWDDPRQVTHGLSNADGFNGLSWTAGGKIVYDSMANGVSPLWLADPASGHAEELLQKGVVDFKPTACGKAGLMVFVATVRSASGSANQIWRANADGSGLKQLTHGGFDTEPSCSPGGRWVVYASASRGNSRLLKVPIEGGMPVQVTQKGASWVPTVSPDGKWILYYHSAGARSPWRFTIRPFAGGKAVRSFPTPSVHEGGSPISVAWMPNSRAFAYIAERGGVSNIVEQPIAGGAVRQLTHYTSGRIFALGISRDGRLALARGSQSSDVVLLKGF